MTRKNEDIDLIYKSVDGIFALKVECAESVDILDCLIINSAKNVYLRTEAITKELKPNGKERGAVCLVGEILTNLTNCAEFPGAFTVKPNGKDKEE